MIGRNIGHFRIDAQLGAGGMGVVYRAWDTRLRRTVAIKLLAGTSDKASLGKVLQEARAASALNHPNICTIHAVEQVGGEAFIVMEHIEGKPLRELIPHDGLPAETVIHYGVQIADALNHAHDHAVVHRDLKSSNVLITPEGRVKVLDFGLAARLREEELEGITRSRPSEVSLSRPSEVSAGALAGTLAYMAPERLRGEAAGMPSDIWALGVTLYEMTTSTLPFKGKTAFQLTAAILDTPAPVLPVRVPAALASIIHQCLAKDPRHRYQRAGEVRVALEVAHAGGGSAHPARRPRIDSRRHGRLRVKALAVLPLDNLSGDPEQEYFADGMTEALIDGLAQIGSIKVISRTSAMRYRRTTKSVPEIAGELGVDAVVEGSVLRAGNEIRINAKLIDARSDTYLWTKSYNRDVQDVLKLQGEVARAIAAEIETAVTPREQARLSSRRRVDPEAYECYLKGRYFWEKWTEDGWKRGMSYFQQAIERDPTYALAYAGLALSYNYMGWFSVLPPGEAFPRAKAAASKALEFDSMLAKAHAGLGFVRFYYEWDWPSAEKAYKRAIELNPNYAVVHSNYSNYLIAMGRLGEAIEEAQKGPQLDPLSPDRTQTLGWVLYHSRRYDEAVSQLQRVIQFEPNFGSAHSALALAYAQKGLYGEAIGEGKRASDLFRGSAILRSVLGYCYGVSGKASEAREVIEQLSQIANHAYVSPFALALIYVGLGEKAHALEWLERAYEERSNWLVYLKVYPAFDALRSEPQFQALLRRVGLEP